MAKQNTVYMVGQRVVIQRGCVYNTKQGVYSFEPCERFGQHKTREAARRAYVTAKYLKADVSQWDDAFVRMHFDIEARNEKSVRLLRVTIV